MSIRPASLPISPYSIPIPAIPPSLPPSLPPPSIQQCPYLQSHMSAVAYTDHLI